MFFGIGLPLQGIGLIVGLVGLGLDFFFQSGLKPDAWVLWSWCLSSCFIGALLLGHTLLGFQTKTAYERTRDHIRAFGRVDDRFYNCYDNYCDRAGVRMAKAEFMRASR
ncbi:MAG: hypothetical protein A3G49_00345 [Candidatus Sungbacteria bacterium RIFCSPLOWO2_12_FULL_41_11]|uniref:Uncharacterized protein n=1 Tax=Candidatus Sungbacteria bacterium RIFCSPLOWO2_12_FULL_41_11 TaxID=1802286 RepID=A0A1G2LPJ5_9BACT|nr:MAG: hypothetical protein A3D41_05710 [Candidatus Sungbacteria bacterium RIFCSPHIGHO2_02_FULL_41_12b]OHA13526.1 MAG: hypothetical protein A3G49_00345 [Candidatus Sungbacteria bacterium RIFCSPLOWO2_12_FULL_41_11]